MMDRDGAAMQIAIHRKTEAVGERVYLCEGERLRNVFRTECGIAFVDDLAEQMTLFDFERVLGVVGE